MRAENPLFPVPVVAFNNAEAPSDVTSGGVGGGGGRDSFEDEDCLLLLLGRGSSSSRSSSSSSIEPCVSRNMALA